MRWQIFNDPQLKEKARDRVKRLRNRLKRWGARQRRGGEAKFKDVGKAAQAFENVSDIFTEDKNKGAAADKPDEPPPAKTP
jgi:hypothetical protein